jgi:nucleoside-diphosphate-sugar epimerase
MSLVLITGVTGFIGSQVALRTLEAGVNVRLVIRREDQADKLRRWGARLWRQKWATED